VAVVAVTASSSKVAMEASKAGMASLRVATAVDREGTEVSKDTAASRATVSSRVSLPLPRPKLTFVGYGGGGNNWRGAPGGGYQGEQGAQAIFPRE
jgi:hypothetical protein